MNILHRRPLGALIVLALSVFVFYAYSSLASLKIILYAFLALLFVLFNVLSIIKKKNFAFLNFSVIFLIICAVFSNVYYDHWQKAYNRFDGECDIIGTVTEIDMDKAYSHGVTIETDSINSAFLSKYKLKMNLAPEETVAFTVGSRLSFSAKLSAFESYSDTFDSEQYYFSMGYNAYAEICSEITVLEHTEGTLSTKLDNFREYLTRRAIFLSDRDAGSLLGALLLGEKSALSAQTRLDFTRSGLSHLLALSGMHLAILGMAFEKLLTLFGLGKRLRKGALIIFVSAYMIFTGMPISVVRAGLMLIIASLLFLLTGSKDTLTNLLLAVLIICFTMPSSVYSLSLWLSAFATLGIVALSELQSKNEQYERRLLIRGGRWCLNAFLASVFAISATLFITVKSGFGISLTSILTIPVFSILAEVYLYAAPILLIFGDLLPIGKTMSALSNAFSYCVEYTSSLKFGYVSSNFTAVRILVIIFTVLFFSFLLLNVKHKRLFLSVLGAFFVSIYAASAMLSLGAVKNDSLVYYSDKSGDKLVATSDYGVMICDASSYGQSSASSLLEYTKENNINYINKYVITNYSQKLDENIIYLYSKIKIESIYLPLPLNDDEVEISEKILLATEDLNCEIYYYSTGVPLKEGNITYTRNYSTNYGEGTAKCAFNIELADRRLCYLSSGMLETKTKEKATECLAESTAAIFGCYGKSYSKTYYLDYEFEDLGYIAISGENIAFNPETLKYYHALGTTVEMHPKKHILYVE